MSTSPPTPSAYDVLDLWEARWKPLTDKWQAEFLSDPRLSTVCQYQLPDVRRAVERHFKLDDIIKELQSTSTPSRTKPKKRRKQPRSPLPPRTTNSEPGFYRMPKSMKSESPAGTCAACGVRYGLDGHCGCS